LTGCTFVASDQVGVSQMLLITSRVCELNVTRKCYLTQYDCELVRASCSADVFDAYLLGLEVEPNPSMPLPLPGISYIDYTNNKYMRLHVHMIKGVPDDIVLFHMFVLLSY